MIQFLIKKVERSNKHGLQDIQFQENKSLMKLITKIQ